MAQIVSEPPDPEHSHRGRARCVSCSCIFDFFSDDVKVELTMMGGTSYTYVSCPRPTCQWKHILEDRRTFGWFWRRFDGHPPMIKLVPMPAQR